MDFACELMDLCRGTQEVEAVLSEGAEPDDHSSRDPLARLKMAMEYEEKKVRICPGRQTFFGQASTLFKMFRL